MIFDIIVVGGGFAGLSAAALAAERGARVLVLDARGQLGGRATAFVDKATGELVDNGQHVLFGCYRATFEFLRRIGAAGNVTLQRTLEIPFLDERGGRSVLRCPPLPPPLHLLGAVLGWEAMGWRDRLAALKLAVPLQRMRRQLARDGRVTASPPGRVADWLRAHGQTPRLIRWLWEPLAVAALNQSPDTASADPFVRILAELFGPDREAAAIALPNVPLHQMYAEPARAFITARGGEVRTNALARLVVERGAAAGVEIRGERVAAAAVVAAVPWFALRSLFGQAVPEPMAPLVAAADGMASMPIVTVNLWYDQPVMSEAFVGLPGRTIQWIFDKRLAFGRTASHLSLVVSDAGPLATTERDAVIAIATREVEAALPAARAARLVNATVVRERQATFSLAAGQPPRPATRTPLRGLVLAGDWIDTGLPGTIESAVVSGHRAAEAILADRGSRIADR